MEREHHGDAERTGTRGEESPARQNRKRLPPANHDDPTARRHDGTTSVSPAAAREGPSGAPDGRRLTDGRTTNTSSRGAIAVCGCGSFVRHPRVARPDGPRLLRVSPWTPCLRAVLVPR